MSRVLRVHGVKHDLSRFTEPELARAAEHAWRDICEQQRFLAALDEERRERAARGALRPAA